MSRATVKAVEPRTTKSGNKPYWRIQLDPGGWASTFSASIGKVCGENVGAELEVTTVKEGDYLNLTAAKLPAGAAAGSPGARDTIISRQVALKCATELAGTIQPTPDAGWILATAAAFAAWIVLEPEPEDPFEPPEPQS